MKTSGTHAFVNHLLVGSLLTIGFGGSVGLATVWMRYQISVVADANRALQQQCDDVQREIADKNVEIEQALNSDVLLAENRTMQLGLEELSQQQIVAVNEDPVYRLVARANQRVFESSRERGLVPVHVTFDAPVNPPVADVKPAVAQSEPDHHLAPAAMLRLNHNFGAPAAPGPSNLTFALNPRG